MVKWIFKRTLLIFISWLGGIFLMLIGIASLLGGCIAQSGIVSFIGIVLILGGIFLGMFSKALTKWIEIK